MRYSMNMDDAPKDRNILIKEETVGYHNSEFYRKTPRHRQRPSGWYPTGYRWVEGRWVEAGGGQPARFVEWCGNARTQTTGSLSSVAWASLPDEDEEAVLPYGGESIHG